MSLLHEFANLDHERRERNGFGEVVFGASKTVSEVVSILEALSVGGKPVLVTRLQQEKLEACAKSFAAAGTSVRVNERAGTLIVNPPQAKHRREFPSDPFVAVVSAGTSDQHAACEAIETCVVNGVAFESFADVGVAGLHRILSKAEEIRKASAVIVCAGMEGALPSVVGGLVAAPVFAVPTSVGYGASFGGIAALLGMINSCASGVTVCNIDNGFGAAIAAVRVIRGLENLKQGRV